MKSLFSIIFVICCCGVVLAEPPSPVDFAYGLPLHITDGASICTMSVPDEVYRHIYRKDLGDLRIFNAGNQMVPHTIVMPGVAVEEDIQWHPLSFFPLPQTPDGSIKSYALDVKTTDDGTIVSVRSNTKSPANTMEGGAVLIDTGNGKPVFTELEIGWRLTDDSVMTAIVVSSSNDLDHWRTMVSGYSLADLRYSGHRIHQNTIPLPADHQRYLRLSFIDPKNSLKITAVKAKTETRKNVYHWLKVEPKRVADETGVFEYDTRASLPIVRIDLDLPEDNSLAAAQILSRPDPESAWQNRLNGLFHNLKINGEFLTNQPHAIRMATDEYWRAKVKDSQSALGNRMPGLRLGYIPHELIFVARGQGPFTLAFGSAHIGPTENAVDDLLRNLKKQADTAIRQSVQQGDLIELGGKSRLEAQTHIPWRQLTLWAVMVLGVAVVGIMAFRLYRNMSVSGE